MEAIAQVDRLVSLHLLEERYWEVVVHRAINKQLEVSNIIRWDHIIVAKIFILEEEVTIKDLVSIHIMEASAP